MALWGIRPAAPGDAPDIVAFVNRIAAVDERLGLDRFPFSAEEEGAFLQSADPGLYLTLTAHDTRGLVGLLTASRGVGMLVHVASLAVAVDPEVRRQGVGLALLEGFVAWARARGVEKCTLSVLAHNAPAIALFRRAGFAPEGLRRGQFRLQDGLRDEVLMALWLTEGH